MRRAQDRARSARSRKNGTRSATIKSRALGALKLASEARDENVRIENFFIFSIAFIYKLYYYSIVPIFRTCVGKPLSLCIFISQKPEENKLGALFHRPTSCTPRENHGNQRRRGPWEGGWPILVGHHHYVRNQLLTFENQEGVGDPLVEWEAWKVSQRN